MATTALTADSVLTAYKIPISVIATWPAPNYVNPVTRHWITPYAIVLQSITTLLVAARLWSRWNNTAGKFAVDDILIVPAWVRQISSHLSIKLTRHRCLVLLSLDSRFGETLVLASTDMYGT